MRVFRLPLASSGKWIVRAGLAAALLWVVLIGLLLAADYHREQASAENLWQYRLSQLCRTRAEVVARWAAARTSDALDLASFPLPNMGGVAASPEASPHLLARRLSALAHGYGYLSICVTGAGGPSEGLLCSEGAEPVTEAFQIGRLEGMKPGGMAFFLEKGSNGRDLLCIASRSRKPAVPEGAFLVVDPAQTLYPALKSDPSFGAPVTFLLASARPPHVVGSSAEAEGAAAGSAALRDSWLARLATAPQPAALERWGGAHYAVRQAVAGTPWTCVALVSRSQALEGVRGRFSAHAAAAGAITLLIFGFLAGVGREAELRHLRAISAQEERHRRSLATLLANLPGMAYRCANNRDWQMEFVSGGALGLTGYAPEELSGEGALPYAQLILPEDRERVWREVQEAIEKRESFTLSYRIRAKTGEERTVWERGCGVFNPDGSLAALEGFITDVSDRVRAQEALRAARGALEQARQLEAVGLVASGVAHEVRNPLFAISAIVAALGQKLQDRPEFGEYVGHIQDQVGRLSTLMNDLLALGRPVDREGFHETDLRAIVRGSLRHLGQATAGAEVRCRLNLPEGEVAITGSPDKLEQVVLNLVQNALFFSPEDQPVDLCLFREGDEAVLEVRDRGPGIPAELMEHLFEPFRSRRKGGTGMGLAIVRKIVTAHGGTVKAQNLSAPAGAAFTVRLPLAGARTNPPASG